MRAIAKVGVFAWVLSLPVLAHAQASITGVVRDTSGAVLPGVTVEAASPALIERVRSSTTDSTGQFRIVDLQPGSYTVTFTLTGFNVVKREAIELTGSFTALVNAEMPLGSLEETITVTGESPIVDVQSTRRQQVLERDVISAIPTGRNYYGLAVLVPGITTATNDVGGIRSEEHTSELQSQSNLVCRLLLEKKKKLHKINISKYTKYILNY